jgi:hypothetical protein
MPVTLATVRTNLRARLDEANATYWTDAQLNNWINEGARDVNRQVEVLQKKGTIAVTGGTQAYAAPSDVGSRIYRIEWVPSGQSTSYALEYMDYASADSVWGTQQTVTQGYPLVWTLWGFPGSTNLTITLYPTPSQAGTLNVFYYRLPATAVADGDTVEVPEGWYDLVEMYAEWQALRKDGDQRWLEAKAIYDERLGNMRDLIGTRYTDQGDAIQPYGAGALPYWIYADDWG